MASKLKGKRVGADPRFYEDGSRVDGRGPLDASQRPAPMPPNGRTIPRELTPWGFIEDKLKGKYA